VVTSVLCYLAAGCGVAAPGEYSSYPVYSAVLDAFAERDETSSVERVFIRASTSDFGGQVAAAVYPGKLTVPGAVLRSFYWANASPTSLTDSIRSVLRTEFFPEDREVGPEDDLWDWWTSLGEDFGLPLYIFSFSRPGFSVDGREAFLYYSYSCGSLCGEGIVAHLRQEDGVWRVVDQYGLWIS